MTLVHRESTEPLLWIFLRRKSPERLFVRSFLQAVAGEPMTPLFSLIKSPKPVRVGRCVGRGVPGGSLLVRQVSFARCSIEPPCLCPLRESRCRFNSGSGSSCDPDGLTVG